MSHGKLIQHQNNPIQGKQQNMIPQSIKGIKNNDMIVKFARELNMTGNIMTPKNQIFNQLADQNRTSSRRTSTSNLKEIKYQSMKHDNGSVTNRTYSNPLHEESPPIQNQHVLVRHPSSDPFKLITNSNMNFRTKPKQTMQNCRSKPGLALEKKNNERIFNFTQG
jgi:hypothetical protein